MVTLSGSNSTGNCLPSDVVILQNFLIPPSQRRKKEIITVFWKPPTINWIKANNDGSVITPSLLVVEFSGIFVVPILVLLLAKYEMGQFLKHKSCDSSLLWSMLPTIIGLDCG